MGLLQGSGSLQVDRPCEISVVGCSGNDRFCFPGWNRADAFELLL